MRIQLRVPEYGWTIQKVFHLMNFLVNGCKGCVAFFSYSHSVCIHFLLYKFLIQAKNNNFCVCVCAVRAVLFGLYKSVLLIKPKVCVICSLLNYAVLFWDLICSGFGKTVFYG